MQLQVNPHQVGGIFTIYLLRLAKTASIYFEIEDTVAEFRKFLYARSHDSKQHQIDPQYCWGEFLKVTCSDWLK